MRHHFHRCGNLRVLTLEAGDLSHARRGGAQILEELCEARRLAPCVGLVECDVLSPAQKRDLLVARVTRLREEEGGGSSVADAPDPRASELKELRSELTEEHREIVEENRRLRAEAAAAVQRNPRPIGLAEEHALAGAGISIFLDEDMRALCAARLDAIERALDGMARGVFGNCACCGRPIEVERLRLAPDTAVCSSCARDALPEIPLPQKGARQPPPPAGRD
jgi:RNA polymerase-binding transcription factor